MDVARKLQLKPGVTVAVLGAPSGVDLGLDADAMVGDAARADAVIAFVTDSSAIDSVARPAIAAALEERLAWIAYPKAGQLGTDLNRDSLAARVIALGGRPVRQVSIDDVWSALRFRSSASA
ncbi:hypothetical protein GCM10027568_19920 [Humibacter soli]